MSMEFNEIVVFGIPERYYRILNLWAVERNFRSSGQNFTAEKIAAEIICEFIDEVDQMEANLNPLDAKPEASSLLTESLKIDRKVKKSRNDKETKKCQTGVRVN